MCDNNFNCTGDGLKSERRTKKKTRFRELCAIDFKQSFSKPSEYAYGFQAFCDRISKRVSNVLLNNIFNR